MLIKSYILYVATGCGGRFRSKASHELKDEAKIKDAECVAKKDNPKSKQHKKCVEDGCQHSRRSCDRYSPTMNA